MSLFVHGWFVVALLAFCSLGCITQGDASGSAGLTTLIVRAASQESTGTESHYKAPGEMPLQRARELIAQMELATAIRVLEEAIQLQPNVLELRILLADTLLRKRYDREAAITAFQGAFQATNSPLACRGLASSYRFLYELDSAIRQYETCISFGPREQQNFVDLGRALYEKHTPREATIAFAEAARKFPEPVILHAALSYRLEENHQYVAALEQAREVARLSPKDAVARQRVANLEDKVEKARATAAKLRSYLAATPDSGEALNALVFVYRDNLGEIEFAANTVGAWIARKPNHLGLYVELARLIGLRQGLQAAIDEITARRSEYPNSPGVHAALAVLLLSRGKLESALAEAREAVALDPSDHSLRHVLSQVLAAKGLAAEARNEWESMKQAYRARLGGAEPEDPALEEMLRPERADSQLAAAEDESAAIETLRALNAAAAVYASTYGKGFPGDLNNLGPGFPASAAAANLIGPELATGIKHNYVFYYSSSEPDESGVIHTYWIDVVPLEGTSRSRFFYTDQTGVIRVSTSGRAGPASPVLQ